MVSKALTSPRNGLFAALFLLQCILHAYYLAMRLDRRAPSDEECIVDALSSSAPASVKFTPDSRQAWVRLVLALIIGSIGSVGMWSVVVALPVVQSEFAASRGAASLAFTFGMMGFGLGGVATGKLTDRFGIVTAIGMGIGLVALGYLGAGLSTSMWQFTLV